MYGNSTTVEGCSCRVQNATQYITLSVHCYEVLFPFQQLTVSVCQYVLELITLQNFSILTVTPLQSLVLSNEICCKYFTVCLLKFTAMGYTSNLMIMPQTQCQTLLLHPNVLPVFDSPDNQFI
jgi:hypothetical protein